MRSWVASLLIAVLLASCTTSPGADPSAPTTTLAVERSTSSTVAQSSDTDPLEVDPDSHTVAELRSVADFEQLATQGVAGQSVVKFSITEFSTSPEIEWLDSSFYTLHDEWYWFQLLNGLEVRGFNVTAPDLAEAPFATVADVYAWADARRDTLPLDLRFTPSDRLYSPKFYETAIDESPDRVAGAGTLIRSPDRDGGRDRWLIELEFSDAAGAEQIDTYFDTIEAAVPDEIAARLFWVPRSRAQEQVAEQIEAGDGPRRDRVVRYGDLAEVGAVEVYSPGIAAGRLLLVTDGGRWTLADAGPDDIVAIDRAPDDLPPGNGLITGTPQTPLAHVNVLALNRAIPNAYLEGLADDTTIEQLAGARAKVLVQTTPDGGLKIIPLTDDEYDGWRATQRRAEVAVDAIDSSTAPVTRTLDELAAQEPSATELDELRPLIGGKAAGFVELALSGATTLPTAPMVVTVRPYVEHMARFRLVIDELLSDEDLDSPRLRYLVLEGRGDYDQRFATARDATLADEFEAKHRRGTPLGDALHADGFVNLIRASEVDAGTLSDITRAVAENFVDVDAAQGLRFRSSSTVEDIEGFNGAGLYDSNTGYLDPTTLADDDHDRTIERALLRTWSSYWSAVAFEERHRENIDHRSGAMAVLVHPRFDDALELGNGVATLTVAPDLATAYEMVVNVQVGDTSVTNAADGDGVLPEIARVSIEEGAEESRIERVSSSSLSQSGDVLDDADLHALFAQLTAVADSWLARTNAELPEGQRHSTLTLDFEFREMADGWPARADGEVEPSRLVVKQARSLDPGLRGMHFELLALPIPRDVLARAVSAVEYRCDGDRVGVRILTDPLGRVDLGFSETPLERWGAGTSLTDLRGDVPLTNSSPSQLDESTCELRDVIEHPTRYLLDILATR